MQPIILNAVVEEIVQHVLTPGGERTALATAVAEDGEEGAVGETLAVHTGEVTQPTEATGAEKGRDGDKTKGFAHGSVGDSAMSGVGNAQHIPGAAHLEALETGYVAKPGSPSLRAPEKGGEDSRSEDRLWFGWRCLFDDREGQQGTKSSCSPFQDE